MAICFRPVTVIGSWTTTQLAQSTTCRVTAGGVYGVDWGDGTVESFVGNGVDQVRAHLYGAAGTYRQTWTIVNPALLQRFQGQSNLWVGVVPSTRTFTALTIFYCYTNQLTGSIPSLTANTALTIFYCYSNQLTGSTPSILAATITTFNVSTNLLPLDQLKLILADFLVSAAGPGRPAVVTISLGGTGNAALDAAALATKAAIIALQPGWIITNN